MRCFFKNHLFYDILKNTSKRINSFLCYQKKKNLPGPCLLRDIQFPAQEYRSVVYLYFVVYKCIQELLTFIIDSNISFRKYI